VRPRGRDAVGSERLPPPRSTLLAAVLLACACAGPCDAPAPGPHRAFYWWRTSFDPSEAERQALATHRVERLFVRFFDVDAEPGEDAPKPLGRLSIAAGAWPAGVELVPVVYLRERTFRHLGPGGPAGLARHVHAEVARMGRASGAAVREWQLDCDWTDTTRETYFTFLRVLGELARADGVALSATIRLHQVKYRERTGVPPVGRGTLMFYNMGEVGPGRRAIFDAEAAASYLGRLHEYPLALDVALPIWSWTVHLREGRVEGLLQATDDRSLAASDALRPLGNGRFAALRTTFVDGALVREGDGLEVEAVTPDVALEAARMVAPHLARADTPRTVTLFDLSERNLARHDHPALERLDDAIR
jgi:hypothetical protein